ncbi:hypothetical protein [Hymenobacter sp. CRA2]|uniref:hypothetical protein n=1 Tax=Hymenobacter sp. CRA2 TaxID=1955620 RepID=UPI00098FF05F|nr:hypothetical protein [Hymenobacter sp. CRA2]OON67178.1 hypothetical protein B0919_18795 [Hymenobacter sp. CRA2]
MRVPLLYLLLFISVSLPSSAANPEWVAQDKKIINEVTSLLKASPRTVERYFEKGIESGHNLGFGWRSRDAAIGGGYISIKAALYYYNGSLVSYTVYPGLPREQELKSKYVQWYSAGFKVSSAGVAPFRYNGALMQKPLSALVKPPTSQVATKAVVEYMSPESGLEYGDYGGYGMTMLQNREAFTQIQKGLSLEQVLLVMHSINPASRLTAIEYYLKNKELFTNRPQIEQWVETVFRELPEVESIDGCIGGKYNAKELVAKFTKTE